MLSILQNVKQGQLFIESLGETHEFGEPFTLHTAGPPTELKATIKVLDENFWTRLFLHTDFGFAGMFESCVNSRTTSDSLSLPDSYMLNEIDVDGIDLNNAFRVRNLHFL